MLRNIPNRYSRDLLVERLNDGYLGQFDFVYLPIDFNSKCNVGYAFINFRLPQHAVRFISEFNGVKARLCLPGFSSKKICEVSYATVQGQEANMENFRDEKFVEKLRERPEWHPLFYDKRGNHISLSKVLSVGAKRRRSSAGGSSAGGATPAAAAAAAVAATAAAAASPYAAMMPPGGYSPFMMGMPPFGMIPPTPFAPHQGRPLPAAASTAGPSLLAGVLPNATSSSMLMVKNVPTSLDRNQVVKVFNERYEGQYDFLFLPGDFHTAGGAANRGFAFINFRSAQKAQQFTKDIHDRSVAECFGRLAAEEEAQKLCDVQQARLGTLEKSIERLQAPPKESKSGGPPVEKAAWYPLLFSADGSPKPFPLLAAPKAARA